MSEMRATLSSPTVVLIERGGRFFVYEPTLGIIVSDDAVEGAYQKYFEEKRKFSDEIERAGLSIERHSAGRQPGPAASRGGIGAELGMFLAKTCIVLLVIAAIGGFAVTRLADRVASAIHEALAPLQSISLVDVVRKAADMARDAEDLPAEKKESLRRSVEILSRELSPIVDAWRNLPAKPEPTTQPAPTNSGR